MKTERFIGVVTRLTVPDGMKFWHRGNSSYVRIAQWRGDRCFFIAPDGTSGYDIREGCQLFNVDYHIASIDRRLLLL